MTVDRSRLPVARARRRRSGSRDRRRDDARQRPRVSGRSSTIACRSSASSCCSSGGRVRRSGRSAGAGGDHRATCSTKAAAIGRRSRSTTRSARIGARLDTEVGPDATVLDADDAGSASATAASSCSSDMVVRPRFEQRDFERVRELRAEPAACSCATCRRRSPTARSRSCSTATIRTATWRSGPRQRSRAMTRPTRSARFHRRAYPPVERAR